MRIKTLLDLLAGLTALTSLTPVIPYLDRGLAVAALASIATGCWCDRQGHYFIKGKGATLIAVVGVILYATRINANNVPAPLVHALVVLLIIRLLSIKQARDYLQIFVLGLFILAASSLLTLDISFIFYLVLLIFTVTIGLVVLTLFITAPNLALNRSQLMTTLRVALLLPLASLILMLGFFVILPRTSHPLWDFLNPGIIATAGLEEKVQPGAFAQITNRKQPVFRAETPALPPDQLYWRALVLNHPQGKSWVRVDPPAEQLIAVEGENEVKLTMYPETHNENYLVTLDRPLRLTGIPHRRTADQIYLTRRQLNQRYRLELTARPEALLWTRGKDIEDFYLRLPDRISPRTRAVAAQIAARQPDRAGRLTALADFFRQQQLAYAEKDLATGDDPIDDFLFEKKRGYCEFFASAYVTLARLLGIPARLVGGYLGGEYNPLGGYYLVTADQAHVWVEIRTSENRWQRLDPSRWAGNADILEHRFNTGFGPLQRLSDALNYFWVQAVISFDLTRQLNLLRGARQNLTNVHFGTIWGIISGIPVLLISTVALLRRRKNQRTAEARLLEAFYRQLRRRHGIDPAPRHQGLAELADTLDNQACREFARHYQSVVFKDRSLTKEELRRLKRLLKKI